VAKKATIKLDPRNARLHPERNLEAVEQSLKELGAGRSIVVDRNGVIIGGNAVYEKAKELGIPIKEVETDGSELVVVRRVDLDTDDPRRKALALADNQIALLAEWDEGMLEDIKLEIEESDFDIDLNVMGFEEPQEQKERYKPNEPAYSGEYQILVIELTEESQAELLEDLVGRGYKCRPLIL